jgi:hypothetical protein
VSRREYFAWFTIVVSACTASVVPKLSHWMVILAFMIGRYYIPFRPTQPKEENP